jgi:cell division protein FtsB
MSFFKAAARSVVDAHVSRAKRSVASSVTLGAVAALGAAGTFAYRYLLQRSRVNELVLRSELANMSAKIAHLEARIAQLENEESSAKPRA